MDFERAKEIVFAINDFCYASIGLDKKPDIKMLQDVSLEEMVEATRQISEFNDQPGEVDMFGVTHRKMYMMPDARLIAAVYVFLHYSARDRDDCSADNVILRIDLPHGQIKFLALGIRKSTDEEDEDEGDSV